jgi:hypothetical protein
METSAKGAFFVAAVYDRRKTPMKMQTRRSQSAATGILQRSPMMINWFLCRWLLALAILALATSCRELPTPPALDNYQLKAVFLSNFAQYTDWPAGVFAGPRAPLVIGILGADPFGTNLENAVRGQKVNFRPLRLRHFRSVDEIKTCQILFISASEIKRLPLILQALKGRSILTVSDLPDFALRGGVIGLVSEAGQIQLQINFEVLSAARLTMSAKMLRTAKIVSTMIE